MFKNIFILFFLMHCYVSNAQRQAENWYFGASAGITFNSGTPVALTDGALSTTEGCASISDFNGDLLFYTDGITVWNRNHQAMPNGNDLAGNPSSTQSGIIVPYPGNPNLYYVFTVDDMGGPDGLQYNIVDITLNGGLGDLTTKNVVLHTPVTEKITAVTHTNGSDIWVISHEYGSANFLAYLVSATGINVNPVVSTVGVNHTIRNNGRGSRGYLKVSPNGEYLASATAGTEHAEVFRFSTATGVVNNLITLTSYFPTSLGLLYNIYGVEFSPDSNKLYISTAIYYTQTDIESNVHQFDLSSYVQADMLNSGIALGASQSVEIGGLQLAVDGKIYVSQYGQPYLGAINAPNTLGLGSNYIQNAVSLAGRNSTFGLPPFIQSYFVVGILADNFCLGDTTEFSVTADANNPITSISWDFGDGNTSTVENPSHTYTTAGTYTVNVTVTTATDSNMESKEITIYTVPTANSAIDFEVCVEANTNQFNLASKDNEVLGSQSSSEFQVAYYPSPSDAQNGTNLLPNLYTNTLPVETIVARIQNVNNPACFDTTSFNLVTQKAAAVNAQTDWIVCDTDLDGFHTFDLSQKTISILNNNSPTEFSVSYYLNQLDLDASANAIVINYTNTVPREEIFWRIENNAYPTCFREGSFFIEVISGVTANTPSNFEACDDDNDGFFDFDLTTKEPEILGAQNAANSAITFHSSLMDAESGDNPINKNNYTNSIAYSETLFARIENTADTSCYDTTSFELQIQDSPTLQLVADWQVCDTDNDGAFLFDLQTKATEIFGGQSNVDFSISFHETQNDADANTNTIVGLYENTSNPQTVFYRIESSTNSSCYLTDSFNLEVNRLPTANAPLEINICDSNETGIQTFDLSIKDTEVLGGQSASEFSVSYFSSEADAIINSNPLSKTSYSNTLLQETIYARIENSSYTACFAISSFELNIRPLPEPNLDTQYVICPDSPELNIDGGDFESWLWRDENNNTITTERILNVTALGNYTLNVSSLLFGISCEQTIEFEVVSSGAPEDFTTEIIGFSDQVAIEVTASGIGDFEYSADGENFQSDNRLIVFPGMYTVYVRDAFLCRTITKEVIALGYLKFFTPNGDGINEHWNVIGMDNFPESTLFVFDRQGKLLQQLSPENPGWDGTFQGVSMPSSDYWFRFENEDGTSFTGHFTLKR